MSGMAPRMAHPRSARGAAFVLAALALVLVACSDSKANPNPTPSAEPVASATATPVPAPTVEPVTHLLFTGDIIPARCTYAKIMSLGGDFRRSYEPLHDMLNAADITIGTLDATASDAVTPYGCIETFSLGAPAAAVEGIRYAGYDVISHAANHIKDCGIEACGDRAELETDDNLRAAGIAAVGSGPDLAHARAPVVIARNGVHFAFLAYDDIADYYHATPDSPGSAPLDTATIAEDVGNARKVADVVIVIPHWGIEYTTPPSDRQREFARAAAAAGADMVVGNHPHWPQAHEVIGNTYVAYALGNFVFDQDWSLETQQGVLLDVTFTGKKVTETRYTAVHIWEQYQPRLADAAESAQILGRIEAASGALEAP